MRQRVKRRAPRGSKMPVPPELRSEEELEKMRLLMDQAAYQEILTHPCHVCSEGIDNRFPAFTICTRCAMKANADAVAPWREEQREVSRARIARMKEELAQHG